MTNTGETYSKEVEDRIVVVYFARPEDVVVAKSAALIPPLVDASKKGNVVLLADAPAELRLVEPSMISFWLTTLARADIRVSHLGVVTRSRAVRVAVSALRAALNIKSRSLEIATFDDLQQALVWGRAQR